MVSSVTLDRRERRGTVVTSRVLGTVLRHRGRPGHLLQQTADESALLVATAATVTASTAPTDRRGCPLSPVSTVISHTTPGTGRGWRHWRAAGGGREGGRERRARPRRQRPVPPGTGLMGRGSFTKKNGREAGQQALLALMTQGTLSARLARRCGQADVPPDRGPRSTRPGPGPRPTLVPQVRNSSLLQLPRPRLRRARIPAGVCARVETPATTMREAPHWPIW